MMRIVARRQQWIRWTMVIAVVALFMPGLRMMARQKRKTHPVRRATAHRRSRHSKQSRRNYTRVQIKPERVKEIQQALVEAGVLHESPNGRWDTATRDAMRQYQQHNGFSPTGLPEAKPLMKLGLGAHPLPPGLGPLPSTETESLGAAEASTASTSPTSKKPASSNP